MKTALVGSTGFVGGNIAASHPFDGLYHSTDVHKAYGTKPQLLIYAGLPAAKYLANSAPEKDLEQIEAAFANITAIAPQRLVLISTVDVYSAPHGVDENTPADLQNPAAYGRNRAILEQKVRAAYPEALIVRLPGLFGTGLKKNFLYDYITRTPAMLTAAKYTELAPQLPVKDAYALAPNGFYKLRALTEEEQRTLRSWFVGAPWSALQFTDSRAVFQFYDLSWLWRDISVALAANLKLLNIATEPVSVAAVYAALTHGEKFVNELSADPAAYDMRSKYDALYHGANGYLYGADEVLDAIRAFVSSMTPLT